MAEERKKLIAKWDEIPKEWDLEDNKVWFVYPDEKNGNVLVKSIIKTDTGKEVIKWMKKYYKAELDELNAEFDNCVVGLIEYIVAKHHMLFLQKDYIFAGEYTLSHREYTGVINHALTNNLVDERIMSRITFFTQTIAKKRLEQEKINSSKDRLTYINADVLNNEDIAILKKSFKFWIGDICRCISSPPNTNRENAIFGIQRIATGVKTPYGDKRSSEVYFEGTDGFLYKKSEIKKLTQKEITEYLFKALSGERFMEYKK